MSREAVVNSITGSALAESLTSLFSPTFAFTGPEKTPDAANYLDWYADGFARVIEMGVPRVDYPRSDRG